MKYFYFIRMRIYL